MRTVLKRAVTTVVPGGVSTPSVASTDQQSSERRVLPFCMRNRCGSPGEHRVLFHIVINLGA